MRALANLLQTRSVRQAEDEDEPTRLISVFLTPEASLLGAVSSPSRTWWTSALGKSSSTHASVLARGYDAPLVATRLSTECRGGLAADGLVDPGLAVAIVGAAIGRPRSRPGTTVTGARAGS